MVKFYQPWCGFCTAIKPVWDQLAEEVNKSVFIVDVNCSDEPDLCKSSGVKGYPTIHVYLNGEQSVYNGGRSFEELYEYVDEHLQLHCIVDDPLKCDKKSQTFIKKWNGKADNEIVDEAVRLEKLMRRDMTYELKRWMKDRIQILRQLVSEDVEIDEE